MEWYSEWIIFNSEWNYFCFRKGPVKQKSGKEREGKKEEERQGKKARQRKERRRKGKQMSQQML